MYDRYASPATNPGLRFMLVAPPGTLGLRETIMNDRDMLRSDFYDEIIRPMGSWHVATGTAHRDSDYMVPFAIHRPSSAGNFTDAELRFFTLLMPHLSRSMRLFRRLREMEVRIDLAGAILDRSEYGVIVTNVAGQIGTANRAAEAILAEADGLLVRSGVLAASRRKEAERLSRLVSAAGGAMGGPVQTGDAMQITRPSGRRPLALAITPLQDRPPPPFHHAFNVNIAVSDPERVPELKGDLLARLYGLTAREARVADLLLQGHSPATAAEMLDVRITTMRSHIQHLLLKTGTNRLPEMLTLFMRGLVY